MESASVLQFLDSAAKKKILGAYLLICSRNEISLRLANEFLTNLYCKKGGCRSCPDCKKVLEGHIDIMRLAAPKIEEIREAIGFVSQKATDSDYKTVVIDGVSDMNANASNCLLKTLEDPPKDSVFILISKSYAGVLSTVASRCAVINISPDPDAESKIKKALGTDDVKAHVLADLSGGFVEEALRISKNEALLEQRAKALEICLRLLDQNNYAISAYTDFLESSKSDIVFVLSVMQSYFHDISMLQKTKNAELVANADVLAGIQKHAENFTTGAISNIIKVILEAERRFSFPVNFRLAAEKMLFDILEEKNIWSK